MWVLENIHNFDGVRCRWISTVSWWWCQFNTFSLLWLWPSDGLLLLNHFYPRTPFARECNISIWVFAGWKCYGFPTFKLWVSDCSSSNSCSWKNPLWGFSYDLLNSVHARITPCASSQQGQQDVYNHLSESGGSSTLQKVTMSLTSHSLSEGLILKHSDEETWSDQQNDFFCWQIWQLFTSGNWEPQFMPIKCPWNKEWHWAAYSQFLWCF